MTKIMLVDDEAGIRKVLGIYLVDAGFDVISIDDGKKAADLITREFFDIVLTDIRMPKMDGISLLKYIKEKSPDTEVIMITGHGDLKLAIESLKLDAVDFITKPINNDILDIAFKRAVDRIETKKNILKYTRNLEDLVNEKTRKLEESERRYVQLFNQSPSYITIQDKDLNIVETNKIFKEHFNYKGPSTCFKAYKGRTSHCPDCPVKKTFKDGKSHFSEMDIELEDGTIRNILIQTSAITDSDGNIVNVMEMSTDITKIMELQDHLASLGLHIGAISHSIKQVLTGMDGGSYLIESGLSKKDNSLIHEGWDIVKEKISKTRDMVLDILFHTKKREPKKEKITISDFIEELIFTIEPKIKQEDIEFNINYPSENIQMTIDKTAINAAFASILENAFYACLSTKKKNKKIDFTVVNEKDRILFIVKDNGTGIAEDKIDKIFDLFYSEKGSKGTGLGLFVALRSIKQHKGKIKVDSEEGFYTQFTITLPL
ncbi:MAG: response regulator [Desulfobacterales bacterium]|nr:response regulator [Desulfobacterales bacterium]MCP4163428.1 response regulator [Deltaproteobacteria bacterium]